VITYDTMKLEGIQISPIDVAARKGLDFRSGDQVRVWNKIQEGNKTRLQAFEGLVIARKHGTEPGASFTVRKVVDSVGVERIYPLYTPLIDKIEVVRRSKVRRSKLYYIRDKATKEVRKAMQKSRAATPVEETPAEVVAEAK
jgi:large subunit ribosomal protein L19